MSSITPVLPAESLQTRSLRVAEVVSALSQALDLGSGSSTWHSVRTCILGMRIAREIRVPDDVQNELYYGPILKDAGCSTNASHVFHTLCSDEISAKRDVKLLDWTRTVPDRDTIQYALKHVAPGRSFRERVAALLRVAANQKKNNRQVTALRCERGATLARLMGLPEGTATGIAGLDEHWDGSGEPLGLVEIRFRSPPASCSWRKRSTSSSPKKARLRPWMSQCGAAKVGGFERRA